MKEEIAAYYKCNMEQHMKKMKQKDMIYKKQLIQDMINYMLQLKMF